MLSSSARALDHLHLVGLYPQGVLVDEGVRAQPHQHRARPEGEGEAVGQHARQEFLVGDGGDHGYRGCLGRVRADHASAFSCPHVVEVDALQVLRLQLLPVAHHHQVALLHDPHAVGDLPGPEDVVGGDEDRLARVAHLHQQVAEVGGAGRVETGGGLIHDHHGRVLHQDRGDAEALAHPLGIGAHPHPEGPLRKRSSSEMAAVQSSQVPGGSE